MINKLKCPKCNSPAVTIKESYLPGGITARLYKCGHADVIHRLSASNYDNFISEDGHRPYQYQIDGALFASEVADGRVLIMDEQGLGKTVQAIMLAHSHPKEMTRFLVLCKAGLKQQWKKEWPRWAGESWVAKIIDSENDVTPGAKGFILSYDTLWRFKDIPAFIEKWHIKYIILDEVQNLKNQNSKRTAGVQIACRQVKYIAALSGTPVKNHAAEFFPILNILRPDLFPTKSHFEKVYVNTYWTGKSFKYGGLQDAEKFQIDTASFIIRRTRAQVLPHLPAISREFMYSQLGGQVEEAYKDQLKQFQSYYTSDDKDKQTAFEQQSTILAYLAKMRHLTGIAKIEPCVDFVSDFIEQTDSSRKIVIFAHHKDVREAIYSRLEAARRDNAWQDVSSILILPEDADMRQSVVEQFKLPQYRILIASTLASSEGLNIQFCSDCVVVEHQWTSVAEDQAEGRFIRIGQTANKVTATYLVAVGTIDEFLVKLKEQKRSFIANAVDGQETNWKESSILQDLAEILYTTGGKQWGWN